MVVIVEAGGVVVIVEAGGVVVIVDAVGVVVIVEAGGVVVIVDAVISWFWHHSCSSINQAAHYPCCQL